MKNTNLLLATALLALVSAACFAQAKTCPDTIAVNQEIQGSIPGWQVSKDDTPVRLAGITFFDGPPGEKASLVYDETKRTTGKVVMIWHFLPNRDRQIWMSCGYSETTVTIAQELPNEISRCSVTYNPKIRVAGLPMIEKIDCK